MKHVIVIVFLLTLFGPSIRFYGKENQIRFIYDGILIELVDRLLNFIDEKRKSNEP